MNLEKTETFTPSHSRFKEINFLVTELGSGERQSKLHRLAKMIVYTGVMALKNPV